MIILKNNYHFILSLIYVALKDPLATVRHFRFGNLRKLLKAIDNEPKDRIIENIDRFLIGSPTGELRFFDQAPLSRFIKKVRKLSIRGPVLIFVTHETTRTGAPLIIKQLADECEQRFSCTPIFVLCRGGEILGDFKSDFISYHIQNQVEDVTRDHELKMLFDQLFKSSKSTKIIVNSAESMSILPYVKRAGFSEITYLIHEMGNFYEKGDWQSINDLADHVIFPANVIALKAKENTTFDKPTLHIAGQGLLKPELLEGSHDVERGKIRARLNIENDAIIVLSCGSTIARKGIDIFTFSAISVLSQYHGKRPLYFLWLGDAPPNYFQEWVKRDIELSNWSDHIIFLGANKDTIPYFLGSDIFFMTSRGDPYPCVVQEAMASGLPVVGFHNTGGYPEMLYPDNSYLADYGDIAGAARIISDLATNEYFIHKKADTIEFARDHFDFAKYADKVLCITLAKPTGFEQKAESYPDQLIYSNE